MFNWFHRYRMRRQMRRQASPIAKGDWLSRLFAPVRWLFAFPGRLLSRFWMTLRTLLDYFSAGRRSKRDLLLGVPAVLLLGGFFVATAMGNVRQSTNAQRYWSRGVQLLEKGEPESAQLLLRKALLGDNINRNEVIFSLARSYEQLGDANRSGALMESLASVNRVGYPAAHRYLAIRTANQVAATKQAPNLKDWYWHLSHADQVDSADLAKSWGFYYLVGGDLEKSAEYFRRAAEEQPELWLQVAELEARMNDMDAVRATLATARRQLERQFTRNPGDSKNRLLYATTLFYMGELPDAERLLKEGLAQEDNESFKKLLAAVFVRMFDVESEGEKGLEESFKYLVVALDYDNSYQPALTRLITVSRSSPEKLKESRETMRRMIADGNATAMAHFALGSLEWLAGNGELAKLNMKQAVALNPKLAVVANNLAYLIALEDDPDLDAALHLATQAIEQEPDNSDYLDTRGMIHLKMKNYALAAVDYQKALERAKDAAPIQRQLAEIYDQLGDPDTAAEFRRAAEGKDAAKP
ncbi:Tetratricopeptide repeat protein [Planctomycetes bacterium CA13]|uniref:Tetratricopeptide repeat protein n=1 Tax=Novipirellula herctigrandis TaxID=2527986 RepID=A0A5C5YYC5_9BACT|nr:Tetratricopeptide repeat protein [Planctomycetes bacterium CA13]